MKRTSFRIGAGVCVVVAFVALVNIAQATMIPLSYEISNTLQASWLQIIIKSLYQQITDLREAILIDRYFIAQDMPLVGQGMAFAVASNECGVDPFLLPAIAVIESNGGRRMKLGTWNAWGWGDGQIAFESFQDGILYISKRFCVSPYYKGKTTQQILEIYNPPHIHSTYANLVLRVMEDMQSPHFATGMKF